MRLIWTKLNQVSLNYVYLQLGLIKYHLQFYKYNLNNYLSSNTSGSVVSVFIKRHSSGL